ncbi:hypothetical protein LCR01_00610 [Companilactobacillus crustorum]|uniref:Uncharacterized protein n=3 Tax=Companilactobacillus TaxID=2767879 RepID=A0A837RJS4_9LACO|nr:hypothetical protein [Companilactobacillus crustorum]HCD07864.1 hypothetical protein [Lactobacillus sp.]APU71001.1 hypothetical protein BI355_0678 [Companilactobacillus crustorum]KRK44319.1 hypothetical protein FD26_GL000676 [Companilactobacillus crustorum JCM 15951]KRO21662.1 hypothetical protein IV63_GL000751 [Companilactobacillus crustorum]WDT66176.1 hypothetical protein NV391_02930 [Companilactobacillus crustorum]
MNIEQLKAKILDDGSGFTFTLDSKPCGMEPDSRNKETYYPAWYGDKNKDFNNIDDLMSDEFFGGKSMVQLIDDIELDFI